MNESTDVLCRKQSTIRDMEIRKNENKVLYCKALSCSDVIKDIHFVIEAMLDFHLQGKTNLGIMILLCFLHFKT